jgi:hypothetical protein
MTTHITVEIKITKPQREAIRQILKKDGVVASSEWVSGSGRYTKARAIPPLCAKFGVGRNLVAAVSPPHVLAWSAAHPRHQYVIAVVIPALARATIDELDQL